MGKKRRHQKNGRTDDRVLYVADTRSPHTVRMAVFFQQRGWDVHIMDVDRRQPAEIPAGITVHYFTPPQEPGENLLSLCRHAAVFLVKLMQRIRPAVLHSHYLTFHGWTAALAAFRPTVATAWGSDLFIEARSNPAARQMTSFALRTASHITADSKDLLEAAVRFRQTGDGSEYILFGIDTDRFRPGLEAHKLKGKLLLSTTPRAKPEAIVLSVRQFKPQANIHVMVEAIPRVLEHYPGTVFVLKTYLTAGTPFQEYADSISRRVEELEVGGNVVILEDIPAGDMPLLYNLADISLSLRDTDGSACSVLESMACGTPVITGSIPAMTEWIDHGSNGMLINHHDPNELAEALIRLLDDRPRLEELSSRARQTAVDRADYRRAWEKLENRYRGLVQRARRAPGPARPIEQSRHLLWNGRAAAAQKLLSATMKQPGLTVCDCLQILCTLAAVAAVRKNRQKAERLYKSFFDLILQANLDTPLTINVS